MGPSVAAVIVAAGRGLRAGGHLPKQYRELAGEPVIRSSLSLFAWHGQIGAVQAVIHPDDRGSYEAAAKGLRLLPPVSGGASRQASVRAGLEALSARAPDIVLIHDAARPFCSTELVSRAIVACGETGAAIPALEVTDTIKRVDADGHVAGHVDRAQLRAVQTPQAFKFAALLDAHQRAATGRPRQFHRRRRACRMGGHQGRNIRGRKRQREAHHRRGFRQGRVAADRKPRATSVSATASTCTLSATAIMSGLAASRIPHDRGLTGHSDADVALHALVDAILGALADGDIGKHFSPNDPRWRGASSDQFLKFAVERVNKRGGRIAHLDLTIVCEAPRIGPHRDAIRKRIAEIAEMSIERVAVKATTSEQLGFTGRKEGIVAMATATVRLPWSW